MPTQNYYPQAEHNTMHNTSTITLSILSPYHSSKQYITYGRGFPLPPDLIWEGRICSPSPPTPGSSPPTFIGFSPPTFSFPSNMGGDEVETMKNFTCHCLFRSISTPSPPISSSSPPIYYGFSPLPILGNS